jgi:hypothetical protein
MPSLIEQRMTIDGEVWAVRRSTNVGDYGSKRSLMASSDHDATTTGCKTARVNERFI